MNDILEESESITPEEAINRVLAKESEMRAAIEACDKQAADRIRNARLRARALADHADRRIQRIHQGSEKRTEKHVQPVLEEAESVRQQPADESLNEAQLERIVEGLAREMIGMDTPRGTD
jgi:vacuolar-type H+-ATPase subunit H